MQFSTIVLVLTAAFTVSAAPGPELLSKRTCGTLSGTALTICQDACKATCTAATLGVAQKLCTAACTAPPLKARADEEEDDAADEEDVAADLAERDLGLDERDLGLAERAVGQKICNAACDVTCNSTVLALAQTKCLEVCKGKC